jgi:hypothetical protein
MDRTVTDRSGSRGWLSCGYGSASQSLLAVHSRGVGLQLGGMRNRGRAKSTTGSHATNTAMQHPRSTTVTGSETRDAVAAKAPRVSHATPGKKPHVRCLHARALASHPPGGSSGFGPDLPAHQEGASATDTTAPTRMIAAATRTALLAGSIVSFLCRRLDWAAARCEVAVAARHGPSRGADARTRSNPVG